MSVPALAPQHHHHHQPSSQAVRLPPVSLPPPDDFLEPPSLFTGGRRQSITDPSLHAFSSGEPHPPPPAPVEQGQYVQHAVPLPPPTLRRISTDDAPSSAHSVHSGLHHGGQAGMHDSRSGTPADGHNGMGPPDGQQYQQQQYGSTYTQPSQPQHSQAPSSHPFHPSSGPAPTYRFGGPTATHGPLDAPSYFDYSMRRHSLSQNLANGTASPPRHFPPHEAPIPSPGLKRKTSGDAEDFDESYIQAVRYGQQPPVGAPPNPKRRTSSLTFEKLSNMSLSDAARRESYGQGPASPWEDDHRRGSNGSYASNGSYGTSAYAATTPGYDQHGAPQSQFPPHAQQHHQQQHGGWQVQAQDIGPRGSISRGPYEDAAFQRRPSIPSVSQMMQGQTAYYPAPPVPSPHPHPSQSYPSHSRPPTGQPAVMVSSVPHTPTEIDEGHSRTASTASYSSIPPNGVPPGIAPWARAGPPPPGPQRQNSASSLDPAAAYGPGGSKDSPYSRSPELRVSHKLAERKRRKEMAQLFEDLRDSLPFDRGLKASKWEILSKAIDYVAQLKTYARDVQQENQSIREHYGLGPSTLVPPPHLGSPDVNQHPPPSSSRVQNPTSSHEASPAPSTAPGGPPPPFQPNPPSQPWIPSAPSPAASHVSRPNTAQPPPTARSQQQSPLAANFPQHQIHHQHPQTQFAYQASSPHMNGAQPSPPLSQTGALNSPLQSGLVDGTKHSPSLSPNGAGRELQQQQQQAAQQQQQQEQP